jgi:hypothetical protein
MLFDIVKYCNQKKCEKAAYLKVVTSGNDPSISKAKRYSQLVSGSVSGSGSVLYKVRIPDAPTNIVANPGISSAILTWSAPLNYGGTKILYYWIFAYPAAPGSPLLSKHVSNTTNAVVAGLTNGASYAFYVVAVNTVGSSAASIRSNSVTPRTYTATPRIVNLSLNGGKATQLILSWSFQPNLAGIYDNGTPLYDGGSSIASYTVQALNSNVLILIPVEQVNRVTSSDGKIVIYNAVIQNLTSGAAYSFRIAATNDAGESPYSAFSITQIVL